MNLKKSIVILTVIAVFIILMAVFALVSFPVAGTVYDYHGYATTIKLGLDLSGGVSAVFNVEDDGSEGDLAARVDGTVLSLQEMLLQEGYPEASVTRTESGGSYSIRVEVPDVNNAEDVLDLIGRPAKLQFVGSSTQGSVGTALPADAKVALDGSNLETAYATFDQNGECVVALRFDSEGTKAFADLTDTDNGGFKYIDIYVNGSLFSSVSVQAHITDGNAVIWARCATSPRPSATTRCVWRSSRVRWVSGSSSSSWR